MAWHNVSFHFQNPVLDLIGIAAVERGPAFRKDEVHKREQCLPLGHRIVITRAGCHRARRLLWLVVVICAHLSVILSHITALRRAVVAMPLDSRAMTQNESLCSSETTWSQIFIHSNRKQTELSRMPSSLPFQPFSLLKKQIPNNFEKDFLFRRVALTENSKLFWVSFSN